MLVAERKGAIAGVECLALTEVSVGRVSYRAAFTNNSRVQPGLKQQRRGPVQFDAAEQWARARGTRYLTGLIKVFDLTFGGPEPLSVFTRSVGILRASGVRRLSVSPSAESTACAMFRPFAADPVDFNFVIQRLGDRPPVPPGPLYFDICN